MRCLLLTFILLLTGFFSFSQNMGFGVGTTDPHPSATLEVSSTNKGFLPPRMTFVQRNAINNPAAGLIIWCSDCLPNGEMQVYNGSEWTNVTGEAAALNYVQLPGVAIGTQIWQSKNLDVAAYRNGDPIPQVTDPNQWGNLTTGAWCWFNNDSAIYGATYGRLYNWYAVADSRGLCPAGWHVPSHGEWTTLTNFLSGTSVAGGKMKIIDTLLWKSPNTGATNSSGFSGLPGNYRIPGGTFPNIRLYAYFWSSTESNMDNAYLRGLYHNAGSVGIPNNIKKHGFSVRCVRD